MKILVTGGAGFIASHVVDTYIKKGHRVAVIDDLSTGRRKNLNPKARFYKLDIRDRKQVLAVIKKERPHIINHHAAIAEVVKSLRDPNPTLEVNVLGTANVLTAGGSVGIKKFIFSSTGGAIYGEPKKIPADEQTPETPLSPYGLSKLLGEKMIEFYARMYGFSYVNFRYPNVYGPRQNPKGEAGVVAIFYGLLADGKRPIIYGDGTKSRDYVNVEDIARANVLALTKGKNITINMGSGKETSDQNVFDSICRELDISAKPKYEPYRTGEVYRIALTNRLAHKELGWKPKLSFREGVKKYHETLSKDLRRR